MNKILNDTINELVGIMTNNDDRDFYIYLHKLCGRTIFFNGLFVTLDEDMLLGSLTENESFEVIYNAIIEKLEQRSTVVQGDFCLHTDVFYKYGYFKVKLDIFKKTYSNVYNIMVEYVFSLPYGNILFDKEAITDILLRDKKLKNIIETYNK